MPDPLWIVSNDRGEVFDIHAFEVRHRDDGALELLDAGGFSLAFFSRGGWTSCVRAFYVGASDD